VITPAIILMRPSALLWALAAGVVVMLYLRSIRPPRVAVARPGLWHQVLGEPRSSASTWRRRRLISAAIHMSVVLVLALAAADPCVQRPRTVVFVVDNSRSMEAVEGGTSRLTRARELLTEHLETIGPREYAAIVTTAGRPVVVSPAEQNLGRVAGAIERIRSVDLPSRVSDALDVASGQTARGTRLQVHLLSDGCFDGTKELKERTDLVVHPLGSSAGNAAVTRLAVRRYPDAAGKFQTIVEVTNRSDGALTAPVRVLLDGETIHQWECQVDTDSTAPVVVDLESEKSGALVAILDHDDPLMGDNRMEVPLPPVADTSWAGPFPDPHSAVHTACEPQSPTAWFAEPSAPQSYIVLPLWPWLVLVAVVLLAIEWTLYHRRWTC
jgi:von Willebrand factor type A domain